MALNLQDKQAIVAEVNEAAEAQTNAYYGKLAEISNGKDTTTGHWEMCVKQLVKLV